MTKVVKDFDCVKMKDELQAQLRREYAGLSNEQMRARMTAKLATSDSPIAKFWRSLQKPTVQRKSRRPTKS